MMIFYKNITLWVFAVIFLPISLVHAQTPTIPSTLPELEEQISIKVSPKFPEENDKVNIFLEAYGTDLNFADITWKVDNKTIKSGKGLTRFETIAPKTGKSSNVTIEITPKNGTPITKTVIISPQDIDLIWEATTYSPPFYRGKTLPTAESEIVISAVPNFYSTNNNEKLSSRNLVYNWKKGGVAVQEFSGRGKNYIKYDGSILLRPEDIILEVYGENKERSQTSINVPFWSPEVLFYERNPALGILFNKIVRLNDSLIADETTYEAYPYSFSVQSRKSPDISYNWSINGVKVNVNDETADLTVRNVDNSSGKASIEAKINHKNKFLQEAKRTLELQYNEKNKVFEF